MTNKKQNNGFKKIKHHFTLVKMKKLGAVCFQNIGGPGMILTMCNAKDKIVMIIIKSINNE